MSSLNQKEINDGSRAIARRLHTTAQACRTLALRATEIAYAISEQADAGTAVHFVSGNFNVIGPKLRDLHENRVIELRLSNGSTFRVELDDTFEVKVSALESV